MTNIKINNTLYPTVSIDGRITDSSWDNRESKSITLESTYDEVKELFTDNVEWSIVCEDTTQSGETITTEYDNSEFCISGDITDHRDGTVTIKMGKLTDVEEAYELMFGGDF